MPDLLRAALEAARDAEHERHAGHNPEGAAVDAESAERAVRDALARIRAVVEGAEAWLWSDDPDVSTESADNWEAWRSAWHALAPDDRRLLGMGDRPRTYPP